MDTSNKNEEGWWSNLSLLQQRIATLAAIALLESCLVYCCWVADTQGQKAPVIHISGLRVMAVTGIFACLFPNVLLIHAALEKASTRINALGKWFTTPLLRSANRLTSHVPLLTQAHGYYTVGRDAEARELTEQVLAQEPENVTAKELLQLIDARQAHSKLELEEQPGLTDKVLDGLAEKIAFSKYTSVVGVTLAVGSAILSLFHCVRYIIMGVTQGWNVTAWTSFDRARDLVFIPIWNAVLLTAIWPTLVSVVLLYIYFPERMDKLLNRGATLCLAISKWGKSHLSAIRNFGSPTARSTPSRSSEPKVSPASRPSSTTRTRRHR